MTDHMREQFEDMMSSQGEWPQAIEKDLTGVYKLATAATAWETWQSAWEAGQEMMQARVKELEAEKAKLVEALEDIGASWHGANTELEKYMRNVARRALAAYRKQGGE